MKLLNLFKKFLPKQPTLLGLTLAKSLRLIELKDSNDGYSLHACCEIPLPSTHAADNVSFAHPEFPTFLKQALQQSRITTSQVALALPYQSVLFKNIEVDKKLNQQEIEIRVREHAEQYFNYPLSELLMDFELLGPSKNHADLMQIRWVAARKLEVETQINALATAGLCVVSVEVDSFSLHRAAAYYLKNKALQADTVAVIQLYETHLLLIVLHKNSCIYTRIENYAPNKNDSDIALAVVDSVQNFLYAQSDNNVSLVLLAGDFVSVELLEKTQSYFNITTARLDVFECLNVVTPQASEKFAINAGLAMRVMR